MPQILFPSSSEYGDDAIERGGRLVNCYAESLQSGGPGQFVRRRAPGLTLFAESDNVTNRGIWYDGSLYVYAAYATTLSRFDSAGTETAIAGIADGSIAYTGRKDSTTDASSYTLTSVPFGTAHADRRIVVGVAAMPAVSGGGLALPTAVDIGGVAATNSAAATRAALWVANVPTGTSGDVVLTYAASMKEAHIAVWRLGGVTTDTPTDTDTTTATPGTSSLSVLAGSCAIFMVQQAKDEKLTASGVTLHFNRESDSGGDPKSAYAALSGYFTAAGTASVVAKRGQTLSVAGATWQGSPTALGNGIVTFAKNNNTTPDQLLVMSGSSCVSFTSSAVSSAISVNSEIPTSITFGEGYFFVGTTTGYVYASAINDKTFSSLDRTRAESGAGGPVVRVLWFRGELYVFCRGHTEVWASNGNPNPSGFPLNRTTVILRGIIGTRAVSGFEEGFEGGLFWVADDNSVRLLQGYNPTVISSATLERIIDRCTSKPDIQAFSYDVDGHACVAIDIPGEGTWVYDLHEGGKWHERDTGDEGAWRAQGNSVKAYDKWLVADRETGNIYEVDEEALDDGGTSFTVTAESILMEAFPQRLRISEVSFSFITGVGTSAVPDPEVYISWSRDGGHTWSDPITRKLGEVGRYFAQLRVNRLGLTARKGMRFRLRMTDEAYFGLIEGDMKVVAGP